MPFLSWLVLSAAERTVNGNDDVIPVIVHTGVMRADAVAENHGTIRQMVVVSFRRNPLLTVLVQVVQRCRRASRRSVVALPVGNLRRVRGSSDAGIPLGLQILRDGESRPGLGSSGAGAPGTGARCLVVGRSHSVLP